MQADENAQLRVLVGVGRRWTGVEIDAQGRSAESNFQCSIEKVVSTREHLTENKCNQIETGTRIFG